MVTKSNGILRSQKTLLRINGFQFTSPERVRWQIFSWFNTLMLFANAVTEINFAVANRADVALAINALFTILYCCNSLPKIVSLFLQRNRVYRFMEKLDTLWANGGDMLWILLNHFQLCFYSYNIRSHNPR